VTPAYEELVAQLPAQEQISIDESPTKEASNSRWWRPFRSATLPGGVCRPSVCRVSTI
jgi:hypothetical protein